MHLRSPSVAPGVSAFLWALAFGVIVWLFMLGIGSSQAMSVLLGALTLGTAFLYIRKAGTKARLPSRR